jgi:hypothetical protein
MSDSNLCRDHRISWRIFCFSQSLHAMAEKGDLAGHERFLQNPDSSLHHHTVSLHCTAFGNENVVTQSVIKQLFWPNSNSGSLVPWLMNLHYFRKFIPITDVITGSKSVWIWMWYQGTLHIRPFTLPISYKHIQRMPAFVKKMPLLTPWQEVKIKRHLPSY